MIPQPILAPAAPVGWPHESGLFTIKYALYHEYIFDIFVLLQWQGSFKLFYFLHYFTYILALKPLIKPKFLPLKEWVFEHTWRVWL